jgi:hypothetical protein
MNREALEARKEILLLGAFDMDQVAEAVHAIDEQLRSGNPNLQLIRALETALVVCYWRPFSQSNSKGHLRPGDAHDAELHAAMKRMRDSAHAHIDKESGRSAGISHLTTEKDGVEGIAFTESWWGLPDEWASQIVAIAGAQREAWRAEAESIRQRLLAESSD